jgi:DNA-binding transcriptional ArsR family regulator
MTQSTDTGSREERSMNALFDCLASSDRRRLLGMLYEWAPHSLTQRDLTTYLVPGYHSDAEERDSDTDVQQTLLSLHHLHLPKFEAAGLIERDTDRETVTITDHLAFEDDGVISLIDPDPDADCDSLDRLFRALADARRRTVLDVLSHQLGPIRTETLARELDAKERDTPESEVPADRVDKILVSLTHVHLPKLADSGLIEYDTDDQMVAYEGHPQLPVPWMHSVLQPEFRQSLTGESDPDGIGEIEGREQVISFGQSLCDRAEEELFCMFTDTQLLEAGCLTRIRDAARERDADVYLGTCDPGVREYIQENAPEVILRESNTDWLNLPVAGDRVGRLLLADREAVMLGTLLEQETDGIREEQAMIGEGESNTLVTTICQLLSPHLEEIDKDTDDFEARLPL